ncbi:uncharacterized protein O3C94_008641 [Discoglossus pictus]
MKITVTILWVAISCFFTPAISNSIRCRTGCEQNSNGGHPCLELALTKSLQSTTIVLGEFICAYDKFKDLEDKSELTKAIQNIEIVTGCGLRKLLGSDATLDDLLMDRNGILHNLIATVLDLLNDLHIDMTTLKCGPLNYLSGGQEQDKVFLDGGKTGKKRPARNLLLGLLGGSNGLGGVTNLVSGVTGLIPGLLGGPQLGQIGHGGKCSDSNMVGNLLGGLLGGQNGQANGLFGLTGVISNLVNGLTQNIGGITNGVGGLTGSVGHLIDGTSGLLGGLGSLAGGLGGLTGGLGSLAGGLGSVTNGLGKITSVAGDISGVTTGLLGGLSGVNGRVASGGSAGGLLSLVGK